ncbi:MAG: L,D-transpeptidase family protein [Gallionella sp.]|jgi:L,D-transpeptidase ErfK/SrfK
MHSMTRLGAFLATAMIFASPAMALTYEFSGDVIGKVTHYKVQPGDNLYRIARQFDIGIVELLASNPGIDPWTPEEGTRLTLPTRHVLPDAGREGIVINLSELRLFYFANDDVVMTFPIGIGKEGWPTPQGETTIAAKRENPAWIPPASILAENPGLPPIIPAGPDNPLGAYAMSLDWESFAIHGTNRPYGVGKRSSHGCIRLYPEDIAQLFMAVDVGTKVTVIDAPYKLGWQENKLWLEVTPNQQQADVIAKYGSVKADQLPGIYDAIGLAAHGAPIEWDAIEQAIARHDGIPVVIAVKP